MLVAISVAEVQLPEEALYQQMRAGEVEAARAGFEALIADYVDQLNAVPADHPRASEAQIVRATQLVGAFRLWQLAEVEQRLAGRQAPADLDKRMAAMADALIRSAATIDQAGRQLDTSGEVPEWLVQDRQQLSQQLGQTMLDTAVFLRDGDLENDRLRFLQEAGRYTAAPATLEELDVQQRDLARTFNVAPPQPASPGEPQALAPADGRTVIGTISDPVRDAAVQGLLENYYRKLFDGEVADLQSQFATGYWPQPDLEYVSAKLSGCVLESLGEVQTRLIATDEYKVEIRGLTCAHPARGEVKMADHLLLRREDGNYRILLLEARNR